MAYGADFLNGGTPSISEGPFSAANLFDNDSGTYAQNTAEVVPWWVKYDLGVGITGLAKQYTVQISNLYDGSNTPKSWTFEGSNNDADWTNLHTVSNETWNSDFQRKYYPISNATEYRYYRWVFTIPDVSAIVVSELEAMEGGVAELAGLTENLAGSFNPSLAAGVYAYALTASFLETSVTLNAVMAGATIKYSYGEVSDKEVASGVDETIALSVGVTTISISVALVGYDSNTYTITVTRLALRLVGKVYIADQLSGRTQPRITNIAIGTGNPTEVALGNEISRREVEITREGKVVTYKGHWDIDDEISGDITEVGLFATANPTSAVLDMKSIPAVTKGLHDKLDVTWEYEI